MIKLLIPSKTGGLDRPFRFHIFFNKAFFVLGLSFLNQVGASLAHAWFLKIDLVQMLYVCMFVSVRPQGS